MLKEQNEKLTTIIFHFLSCLLKWTRNKKILFFLFFILLHFSCKHKIDRMQFQLLNSFFYSYCIRSTTACICSRNNKELLNELLFYGAIKIKCFVRGDENKRQEELLHFIPNGTFNLILFHEINVTWHDGKRITCLNEEICTEKKLFLICFVVFIMSRLIFVHFVMYICILIKLNDKQILMFNWDVNYFGKLNGFFLNWKIFNWDLFRIFRRILLTRALDAWVISQGCTQNIDFCQQKSSFNREII